MVIEQSPRGERSFDIYSRLLNDRVVFLGSAIDHDVANLVVAQLLHLDAVEEDRLVGDRDELLRACVRDRAQARALAAREDEALEVLHARGAYRRARDSAVSRRSRRARRSSHCAPVVAIQATASVSGAGRSR